MPPWLTAKVESRLAELAFAAGLDPALLADKPIIMTTLTEPEEDTKEAVDVWERTCDKCGRSGQYRKATLVARYGADARLPDVRQQIAACDRRSMLDQCGVKFVELTPQPLRFQSRS